MVEGVRTLAPVPCKVLVLAGPGNNGGDGAVAAVNLLAKGYEVEIVRVIAEPTPGSDASRAFALWRDQVEATAMRDASLPVHELELLVYNACVIVDAMFGAGLSRALSSLPERLVNLVNASSAQVVAVDVPSGLNGNTHQTQGACIRADLTVSFFLNKPAHVLFPGRQLCGRVLLSDIGLSADQLDTDNTRCWLNEPVLFKDMLRQPELEGHKFQRGHVLVRGGPIHSTGAARLAATTGDLLWCWTGHSGNYRKSIGHQCFPAEPRSCCRKRTHLHNGRQH